MVSINSKKKSRVCLISTGGTISSIYDEEIMAYRPGLSAEKLLEALPEGTSDIEVIKQDLFQLDSANAQPHHWVEIAAAIKEADESIENLDGIVVLHGTDTMAYSASATSFFIQEFGRPIVFTGSQIAASVPWSDGPRNLLDALRVAAWGDIGEVCIVFNGEIHRATRTRKIRERALDAFDTFDQTPLGVLAREIVLYESRMRRTDPSPQYDFALDERVFLLKTFPGMNPDVFSKIVELGYKGIVIEGFGSGNIPTQENSLTSAIREVVEGGYPVFISSQCAFGQADLSLYEVGKAALEVGALSAHDMTSEAAVVKLMWVLGHTKDLEEIEEMMTTNYVGEISFSGAVGLRGT